MCQRSSSSLHVIILEYVYQASPCFLLKQHANVAFTESLNTITFGWGSVLYSTYYRRKGQNYRTAENITGVVCHRMNDDDDARAMMVIIGLVKFRTSLCVSTLARGVRGVADLLKVFEISTNYLLLSDLTDLMSRVKVGSCIILRPGVVFARQNSCLGLGKQGMHVCFPVRYIETYTMYIQDKSSGEVQNVGYGDDDMVMVSCLKVEEERGLEKENSSREDGFVLFSKTELKKTIVIINSGKKPGETLNQN